MKFEFLEKEKKRDSVKEEGEHQKATAAKEELEAVIADCQKKIKKLNTDLKQDVRSIKQLEDKIEDVKVEKETFVEFLNE